MPVAAVATAAGATSCEPSTTTTITTTGISTGAAAATRSTATPTLRSTIDAPRFASSGKSASRPATANAAAPSPKLLVCLT